MSKIKLIIALLIASTISACTSGTDSSDSIYFQDFGGSLNCEKPLGFTPQPLCLSEDYFTSASEFNACQKTISTYSKEIDRWKKCRADFLEQLNNLVIKNVERTKSCLKARQSEDPPCPLYKLPADLEVQMGDFAKEKPGIEDIEHWETQCTHLSGGIEKYHTAKCNNASQKYKNIVFQKLKRSYETDAAAANTFRDKTIEHFNCKSKGDRLCK